MTSPCFKAIQSHLVNLFSRRNSHTKPGPLLQQDGLLFVGHRGTDPLITIPDSVLRQHVADLFRTGLGRSSGPRPTSIHQPPRSNSRYLMGLFKPTGARKPSHVKTVEELISQPVPDGLVFGRNHVESKNVVVDDFNLRSHVLITGKASVSRETLLESLLAQQLIRGGGFLYIASRSDKALQHRLEALVSRLGDPGAVAALTPDCLDSGQTYDLDSRQEPEHLAQQVMQLLPPKETKSEEDLGLATTYAIVTTIIAAMQAIGTQVSFSSLAKVLSDVPNIEEFEHTAKHTPEGVTLSKYFESLRVQQNNEFPFYTDSVVKRVGKLVEQLTLFAKTTGPKQPNQSPGIRIADIWSKDKGLYVGLPTMGKDSTALTLGRLLLQDLINATKAPEVSNHNRRSPPFLAIIEDPADFGFDLNSLGWQARARNVALVLVQEDLIYPFPVTANLNASMEAVLSNTATKLLFRSRTGENAQKASDLIGVSIGSIPSLSPAQLATLPEGIAYLVACSSPKGLITTAGVTW